MNKDTSGTAFPFTEHNHDQTIYRESPGMTLRQYYAGLAMQGMLHSEYSANPDADMQQLAQQAFIVADAMIAEGNK